MVVTQRVEPHITSGPRRSTAVIATPPPFQRFVDRHREDVWRFLVASVGPIDAEDCFQETFISALKAYPRLRPSSNLKAWVLTIAHRKAIDTHRQHARRPVPVAEVETLDGRAQASPRSQDGELWQAVRELPPRQRSAVVLRFVADMPHREIADAIGCSEDAARQSLHEGLAKLRRRLPTDAANTSRVRHSSNPGQRSRSASRQPSSEQARAGARRPRAGNRSSSDGKER
jgi:RNA polymerase sigma factor (sigma-70 family)